MKGISLIRDPCRKYNTKSGSKFESEQNPCLRFIIQSFGHWDLIRHSDFGFQFPDFPAILTSGWPSVDFPIPLLQAQFLHGETI